jgi:NADH-quinone oxidoreductase subunit C
VPDATGLELIAQRVRERLGDEAVLGTQYYREQATLQVAPASVRDVLTHLRDTDPEPYERLMSVHGCDYLPEEPRFGVHYELLSTDRCERLRVKTRLTLEEAESNGLPSIVEIFPGAEFHEREVFDFFGVVFRDHPDLRRIAMPEDYVGHPQRRDFPMGGEEVLFTFNEHELPRWYDK